MRGRLRFDRVTSRPYRYGIMSALFGLFALVVYAAPGSETKSNDAWLPLIEWTSRRIAYVAPFNTNSAVQLATAGAFLLATLYCLRISRSAFKARSASSLELVEFADARAKDDGVDIQVAAEQPDDKSVGPLPGGEAAGRDPEVSEIESKFREHLNSLTVRTPAPLPLSEVNKRSVIGDITSVADSKGQLAIVARILALLVPPPAYRVTAVIRAAREPGAECGLTIDITMPSGRGSLIETVRSSSWEETTRAAADVVAAFLISRTRLSRRGMWRQWQGQEVPRELVKQHRLGQSAIATKDYAASSAAFNSARTLDPLNPWLRIELAQIDEQRERYLHAALRYADIVATERWQDEGLRSRLDRQYGPSFESAWSGSTVRSNSFDALFVARYRLAARLSSATAELAQGRRALARQDQTRIDDLLRTYIPGSFEECYGVFSVGRLEQIATRDDLTVLFLRSIGLRQVEDLARAPIRGALISPRALKLMSVWASLHLRDAEETAFANLGSGVDRGLMKWTEIGSTGQFPPSKEALTSLLRNRRLTPRANWDELYNAACVFAVGYRMCLRSLGIWTVPHAFDELPPGAKNLAHAASVYLELATRTLHSSEVPSQLAWVRFGDPDLKELRQTPYFATYLVRYLPGA